jgi:hypothetical protein
MCACGCTRIRAGRRALICAGVGAVVQAPDWIVRDRADAGSAKSHFAAACSWIVHHVLSAGRFGFGQHIDHQILYSETLDGHQG